MRQSQQAYTRRVPFADTDAAGVVHFSKILCYIEEAEHAYLLNLGLDVVSEREGWPVVKVDIDYRKPLRFNDEVDISIEPFSIGKTSVSWSFAVFCDGNMVAEGILTTVRVDGVGKSCEIPEVIKQSIQNKETTEEGDEDE
ncbi:acyl-CoA thioesterase [Akkermansiaceae bacterium]|nr:acyl-CoA thioesterase [Akkermansiaceae bacterium]